MSNARLKILWLCLLAFPAIVFAGDFDLPELPEAKTAPEPTKAFKPIAEPAAKPAPEKNASKDAPKDAPEQSDYDVP